MRFRPATALLTVASLLAIASCGGPTATRDERLSRGDALVAQGKVTEAIVEYRSAVQADPNSGEARKKLGDAYVQVNDVGRAIAELVRAADLLPADVSLQLRAGRMLLLTGQFEDARGRAEKVLAGNPKSIEGQILKGNALAGLKDFEAAMTVLESAVATDPTRGAGYAHLGALQFAQGEIANAEAAFKLAIAAEPSSVPARLALANLYWSSGRTSDSERLMRECIALEPRNVVPNRGLALILLGTNRLAEAEAPLKVVAEVSETSDGQISLADFYANQQRIPEARAVYERLATGTDENAGTAKLRLAALGLVTGNRSAAYQLVDDVLAKNPAHVEALIARGQLLLDERKLDEALVAARKAVATGPSVPTTHFLLGRILRARYQPDEAQAEYQEAIRVSTSFAPAHLELARLALINGRYDQALTYAQAAIDAVPGLGDAYLLLARAKIATGDVAGADKTLRVVTANLPDSPVISAEVGRLQLAKGDKAGARAAFASALNKEPGNVSALEGMVTLDWQEGKKDAARRRLDQIAAMTPVQVELNVVAARLFLTLLGDPAAAEKAARRALDADANNLDAFGLVARVHVQRGDLPAATKEFEELAKRQPKSIANQTAVGMLYHLQGKLTEARAAYERALSLDPRAAVASNNLAQIYSDANENLDVGIRLAQAAKAALPNSHEIDDTLGWLYYKRGLAFQAIGSLRSAVAAQPDNPVYLYHLGAAYALNKDKANARQTLEKALKKPPFDGSADARKVLDSLK